ncbi:MAG: hypothetical protein WBC51_06365 [Vicinamibacterales bacterium]
MSDVFLEVNRASVATLGPDSYRYGATTDGEMWVWDVSFDDVKNSPDWVPGQEPSLPISRAIELAGREVEKYTAIPRAYRLEQVEWLHIGNYMTDERKWIYLVTFERQYRFEGQEFEARGTLRIPVLLDGRVIVGKKEDWLGHDQRP